MDVGDLVIFGRRRFRVRGFDPEGVRPRLLYLEDEKTKRVISVAYEEKERIRPVADEAREAT
jgi:hypothetical protein